MRTDFAEPRKLGVEDILTNNQDSLHQRELHQELRVAKFSKFKSGLATGLFVEKSRPICKNPFVSFLPRSPRCPIEELPEEPDEDPIDEEAPTVPPAGEVEPEAPRPSGVCDSLPAEGGIIDTSSCVWLRGPANYWHHENDGHGGSLA